MCAVEGFIDRDRYGGGGEGNPGIGVGDSVTEGAGVCVGDKCGDGVGVVGLEVDDYGVGIWLCRSPLVFKVDGIA
jgi:hypothetical protein